MNYKSELRGWAFDRALRAVEVSGTTSDLNGLIKHAEHLAVWAYVPDKDLKDTITHLAEIIKDTSTPLQSVEQLLAELGVMKEEIERQMGIGQL